MLDICMNIGISTRGFIYMYMYIFVKFYIESQSNQNIEGEVCRFVDRRG